MERACLFVCLFVVLVHDILGQVGSLCRDNERLLSCGGCQKTCLNPVLECKGICKVGCYCNEGEVRNATGHCIKLADCPPLPPTLKQDTTEPRDDIICKEGEEYRFCEPCNRTCENPNPICPAQCARGCFCRGNLVRDSDGRCVSYEMCSNRNQVLNTPAATAIPAITTTPIAYQLSCGPRQIYKHCENCEKTCSNPNPRCPAQCSRGCFCKDGYYKAPNGECVKVEDCPKAHHAPAEEVALGAHLASIDDCDEDEEYYFCGWCEPSCSDPRPECPMVCTSGCLCKPPLIRHRTGRCVEQKNCAAPTITSTSSTSTTPSEYSSCSPRQIYKICENCEKTCINPNPRCQAECTKGCFCKEDYYKTPNGECVKLEDCPKAEESVLGGHLLSIDDCDTDEEYYSCGWCEPSCSNPKPQCPKVCTSGCLCKPPLVRHRSGHCVEQKNCAAQRCLDPNEEYVCRYGCEARCEAVLCVTRPKRCSLGCHCKQSFVRDSTGLCVALDKCTVKNNTTTNEFNNNLDVNKTT